MNHPHAASKVEAIVLPEYFDTSRDGIRLVVSDLDGTLLNEHSLLTPEAIEVIQKLREEGVLFTFATGRMDVMTWTFADALDLDLPIISTNGALLRDRKSKHTYFEDRLNDDVMVSIFNYCLEQKIDILLYTADEVYAFSWSTRVSFMRAYNQRAEESGSPLVPVYELDHLPDPGEAWRGKLLKAFIRYDDDQHEDLVAFLDQFEDLEIRSSAFGSLDVNAPNCSKGRAVEWLANSLDIPLEHVCTIGDQENDLAMLEISGLSLAMDNARPVVKEISDHILPSHYQNGFAEGIHQYILKD